MRPAQRAAAAALRPLRRCAAGAARGGIDVARERLATPGCAGELRFLNSAGSSLPTAAVLEAQLAYLRREAEIGGYATADEQKRELEAFYPAAARLLGCAESEVAFVESATRAWTLLFHSVKLAAGDRVLTSASDYGSNFVSYILAKERQGVEVVVVPDDEQGQIDLSALRDAASHPRTKLISLNHVPTCGGTVQPAQEIGDVARSCGVPFLLDACQSVGQLDIDVGAIGCDMLSATGRKYLRGPRGTGFLYIREGFLPELEPVMLDQEGAILRSETQVELRRDARVFEQYECNFAGKVGFTLAIEHALSLSMQEVERRVCELSARLRAALGAIPGVEVTDVGARLCGIVTFQVEGVPAKEAKTALKARNFDVSVAAAAGGAPRVWFDRRGLTAVVRASPHYYNTEREVDELAAAVAELRGR